MAEYGEDEEAALRQKLEQLAIEHRDMDDAIAALTKDGVFDQLQIQRLKRKKLALKDQITQIQSQLIPNIIA